jgi:PPP family 3-phenylpropionic acid transporter
MPAAARLAAFYFAFFAHAGAFVSYFALYLDALGFAAEEIALVLAMPQLARIVAPAFWGWLADVWSVRDSGARRAIVLFSACAMLAGFSALAALERPLAVALVLLAIGLASAGAGPLVEAITLSALGGRPGGYGAIRLWGSIGFIAAVLGTGTWLDRHPPATLAPLLIVLAALVCVAAWLLPGGGKVPHARGPSVRLAEVLRQGEVRAFLAATFCMTAAHGTMYVFYSLYLASAGYSKSAIGAFWTLGVLAEIALFLRLPALLSRFRLRSLLLASFACAVVRFLAIGWGVDFPLVLGAAQLLHAATFGAFHAASVAAVHRLFPEPLEARGQALYSSASYGIGGAAGAALAGPAWEALGPAPSFALSALFAAGGAMLVARNVRM